MIVPEEPLILRRMQCTKKRNFSTFAPNVGGKVCHNSKSLLTNFYWRLNRSLKELTYMIDVIDANAFTWQGGVETKDFDIQYELAGETHIYHGDFLVNNKIFVEIKPKRLMNTKVNVAKRKAAIKFCQEKGYEYHISDVKTISEDRLIGLFENGSVKFIEKYKKRIFEKCRLKKQKQ